MSTSAIIMMLASMATVWGGLIAASIFMIKNPEQED